MHICSVCTEEPQDLCATGDHDCQQVCISTKASYKCGCKDGFTLMDDGRSCSGECVCVYLNLFVQTYKVCFLFKILHSVYFLLSTACSNSAIDLVFVIDGSKSVRPENFELVKKWINQIIDKLDVSEKNTHVGLVQYSSTVKSVSFIFKLSFSTTCLLFPTYQCFY